MSFQFVGRIECISCGRAIKKSFNQGYCFPCFQTLAACDICIVKPELCHYRNGTCREPQWGEKNCLIEHVVYLANTTSLKVGITKSHQTDTRWGDQGAGQALVMAVVPERYLSGLIERELGSLVADRTDWRALIKGEFGQSDLLEERKRLSGEVSEVLAQYLVKEGEDDRIKEFRYPVLQYPQKAKTVNLEKTPEVKGDFEGIRGQYVFIGGAALNIRKFAGYEVVFEIHT